MKIIVVGLGSMGRRRVRLLKHISDEFEIVGVDGREDRRKQAEDELSIETCGDLEKALSEKNPDCAVISTSPLSHADIIETCLNYNCHVFTELNLRNTKYESNMKLAEEKGKVLFLSSTFLYRNEIKWLKNRINESKGCVNYNYHIGQYLPDWHPWESFQNYFVGDKRTNGCREIFAIEFPWILDVFGEIESYEVLSSKNTDLPIDYNDNYLLLIKHKNGNKGVLAVDVVSRKAVRNLEVYSEDVYVTWDGSPEGMRDYDYNQKENVKIDLYENIYQEEKYASFVIENAYQNELETFLGLVKGEGMPQYTFEDDLKVLEMIDKIEGDVE